jgi:hypothetical protein
MPSLGTCGNSSKPLAVAGRTLRDWLYALWRGFNANFLTIFGLFFILTANDYITFVAGINALAFGLSDLIDRHGGDRSLSRALQIVAWSFFAILVYLIYRSLSS